MPDPVSERLRRSAADTWQACFEHPFVQAIGRGDLDETAFRRYLVQDYVFLVEYCRVLALASARAPSLDAQTHFADLTKATLTVEMDLHRRMCRDWGIGSEDLERSEPMPTTSGYTAFLVKTASMGDYGELCAALLPCQWGYADIGTRLAERGLPEHPRYAAWIQAYAEPGYVGLTDWLRRHVDALGAEIDDPTYLRWRTVFRTSLRYEHAFWDMAWGGERWTA